MKKSALVSCLVVFLAASGMSADARAWTDVLTGCSGSSTSGFLSDGYACYPIDMTTFGNRVHVRCSAGASNVTRESAGGINYYEWHCNTGIVFFALPMTASSNQMTAFVTSVQGAMNRGTYIQITFDKSDTTTGPAYGCGSSDCRKPLTFWTPL